MASGCSLDIHNGHADEGHRPERSLPVIDIEKVTREVQQPESSLDSKSRTNQLTREPADLSPSLQFGGSLNNNNGESVGVRLKTCASAVCAVINGDLQQHPPCKRPRRPRDGPRVPTVRFPSRTDNPIAI